MSSQDPELIKLAFASAEYRAAQQRLPLADDRAAALAAVQEAERLAEEAYTAFEASDRAKKARYAQEQVVLSSGLRGFIIQNKGCRTEGLI